jgi:hypothetical protein
MELNEKTAARLKADQRRFMDRQSERLKQIGIHPAFTVSSVHIRVTDQKSFEDRHKPDILYAEWTAKELDGQVIVTRTEYRYLENDEGA